jgi:hypothetical protein
MERVHVKVAAFYASHQLNLSRISKVIGNVAQLNEFVPNPFRRLLSAFLVRFANYFRVKRFLIRIIHTGEPFDFPRHCFLVEPLDVAFNALVQRTFCVYLYKISDEAPVEIPDFTVRRDGGGNRDHIITCQQMADEPDPLDVRVTVFFGKTATSPSKISTFRPAALSFFSKMRAIVDLPDPDKPVNQTVTPCDITSSMPTSACLPTG